MSNTAPTWGMSFVPVILLTWFALGWLLRGQRFCPRWQCQCALAVVSVGVAVLPVGGLPVGGWFAAFVPGLSLPMLALLMDGINRHAGGTDWLPSLQRSTVFIFAALAGLALYPSAMGWGRFDIYTLGWNFSPLTVAVGALTLWLIWRGNRFNLVLVVALLAWQWGLMESRNFWDYLVDPVLFLLSVAALAGKLGRRKHPASNFGGSPIRSHLTLPVAIGVLWMAFAWLQSSGFAAVPEKSRARTVIREENKKAGALDWQLTRVRVDKDEFRSPWIEGYCSRQSVKAGESIDVMVSTDPPRAFNLEIFRMGYYGGRGARLMQQLGPFTGKKQPTPTPAAKNLHECAWESATRLTIPKDWVSGVYLGRLTTIPNRANEPYWQSYVVFIVRDDRRTDILFQCSDNTWQAYNRWPNNFSVYTDPKGGQGPWADVSFDRPYGRESQFTAVVNDPLTVGSGEFLPLEFPLAYWLEEHGYDVTYCANSDLLTPDRGLKCKAFISVGHDEYWDIRQFRSVERLRDAGVNLLFLSGNAICWVTPLRAGADGRENRIMFRGGPYGATNDYAVERERDHGPFPERGPDEGLLMGVRNIEPINGGGDWTIVKPGHWIFAGTGVKAGDRIPGLIGWEYHGDPATIPGLEIVGAGTAWVGGDHPQKWAATIYPGPKGNFVFNASSIFWAQGLSSPPGHTLPWSHWSRPHGPDPRVQRITANLLDRAIGVRNPERKVR